MEKSIYQQRFQSAYRRRSGAGAGRSQRFTRTDMVFFCIFPLLFLVMMMMTTIMMTMIMMMMVQVFNIVYWWSVFSWRRDTWARHTTPDRYSFSPDL